MLAVQKYLEKNSLEKLNDDFAIKSRVYNDRVVLKYGITDSEKYHPIVKECRGLILSLPDYRILSRSFDRFFNYKEGDDYLVFEWQNSIVFNKLDGCLDYDVKIDTEEYGELSIGYIVENKIKCSVKSYDLDNKKVVYSEIEDYSEKENIGNWVELELENGNKIKITEDHYVYLPGLNCWRKVKDLNHNDYVLIS